MRQTLISFAVGVSLLLGALATTFVPTSASAQHHTRYGHYYHQGHYYPYRYNGHYYNHRSYYHHHYRYY